MADRIINWVGQHTTTTGTGAFIFGDRIEGPYSTFAEAVANGELSDGDRVFYTYIDGGNSATGLGTYHTSPERVERDPAEIGKEGLTRTKTPINCSGAGQLYTAGNATAAQALIDLVFTKSTEATVDADAVAAALVQVTADLSTINGHLATAQTAATTGSGLIAGMQAMLAGELSPLVNTEPAFKGLHDAGSDFVTSFVYDARLDGTAQLLKNATHTSWYDEANPFPVPALFVLKEGALEIRKIDSANTLWMSFDNSGSTYLGTVLGRALSQKTCTAVSQGKLYIGGSYSAAHGEAYLTIDFLTEKMEYKELSAGFTINTNIAGRNAPVTITANGSPGITNITAINDIAVYVAPNAPVDAFGRLKQFVAIATQGGPCLITPAGDVFNGIGVGSCEHCWFNEHGDLFVDRGGSSATIYIQRNVASLTGDFNMGLTTYTQNTAPRVLPFITPGVAGGVSKDGVISYAQKGGLTQIRDNRDDHTQSEVRYIGIDYATPFMAPGTVAMLFCGTETGNIGGVDYATNGDFSAWTGDNPDDWTVTVEDANNYVTEVSGAARIVSTDASLGLSQNQGLVVGRHYVVLIDITVAAGSVKLGTKSAGDNDVGSLTATGTYELSFVAESPFLYVWRNAAVSDFTINSIQTVDALTDYSGNGNHARVIGSIDLVQIAGTNLVAISGVTENDYPQIPYSNDFDVGTGDFAIFGVANGNDTDRYLLERNDTADTGTGFYLYQQGNGNLAFYKRTPGAPVPLVSAPLPSGWVDYAVVRVNGVVKLYLLGQEMDSAADTTDYNNPDAVLRFGRSSRTPALAGSFLFSAFDFVNGTVSEDYIADRHRTIRNWLRAVAKRTLSGTNNEIKAVAAHGDKVIVVTPDGGDEIDRATGLVTKRYDSTNLVVGGTSLSTNLVHVSANDEGTLTFADSDGKVFIDKPEVQLHERQFEQDTREFMARVKITPGVGMSISLPDGETFTIDADLTFTGKVNEPTVTTLPAKPIVGDTVWYDDGSSVRKVRFDEVGDWRVICEYGATI